MRNAVIKKTQEKIHVYRLKQPINGKEWCNGHDCKTVYHENELQFNDLEKVKR